MSDIAWEVSTKDSYPKIPTDEVPDDLREDLYWITPWIREEFPDNPRRIDWHRYGRDADGDPVYSQLILYDGKNVGWQEGRKLVDEHQLGVVILRSFGIEAG